ncbi:hypothetical protein M2298_004546 [Brevibacillus sp. 1238]|nr:hypothetical protein [Brevibacillus sp. 1238]
MKFLWRIVKSYLPVVTEEIGFHFFILVNRNEINAG